jgi:WD40 repeat protein
MAIESATGRVWAGDNAQKVYCWSPNLDVELLAWEMPHDVWSIAVARGRVYIGDARGTIHVADANAAGIPTLFGQTEGGHVGALAVSASGAHIIAGSGSDGSLRVFDIATGTLLHLLSDDTPGGHGCWTLYVAPAGAIYVGTDQGTVRVWSAAYELARTLQHDDDWLSQATVTSIAVDDRGRVFAVATSWMDLDEEMGDENGLYGWEPRGIHN